MNKKTLSTMTAVSFSAALCLAANAHPDPRYTGVRFPGRVTNGQLPSGRKTMSSPLLGGMPRRPLRISALEAQQITANAAPVDAYVISRVLTGLFLPSVWAGTTFDPAHWNVSVIAGLQSTIFSNQPTLKPFLSFTPDLGSSSPAVSRSRRRNTTSLAYYTPSMDTGSGPYRRIVSNYDLYQSYFASTFYEAFEIADVDLYCNNIQHIPDAGQALMGGWSGTGDAVDAGAMYNLNLSPTSLNNYTPIMRIAGVGSTGYTGTAFDIINNQAIDLPAPFRILELTRSRG